MRWKCDLALIDRGIARGTNFRCAPNNHDLGQLPASLACHWIRRAMEYAKREVNYTLSTDWSEPYLKKEGALSVN